MNKWIEKLLSRIKKSTWSVPDLSKRNNKNNKRSAGVVENLIDFNQENREEKKDTNYENVPSKNNIAKEKKSNKQKRKWLTLEDRLTPTLKRGRGFRNKKYNTFPKKPAIKKILGPMGYTYVKDVDQVDVRTENVKNKGIKNTFSPLHGFIKNDNGIAINNNEDIVVFSRTYQIDELKDEDLEIVVNKNSKWQKSKHGITIGRTVRLNMDTNIEEVFELNTNKEGTITPTEGTSIDEKFELNPSPIDNSSNKQIINMASSMAMGFDDEDYDSFNKIDKNDITTNNDSLISNQDENVDNNQDYTETFLDDSMETEVNEENDIENSYEDQANNLTDTSEYLNENFDMEKDNIYENSINGEESISSYEASTPPPIKQRNFYINYQLPPISLLDEIDMTTYDQDREEEADLFTKQIEEVISIMKLPLYITSRQIGSRLVKFQCPFDAKEHNFKHNEDFKKRVKAMIGNEGVRFRFPLYGMSNTFGIEVPFIKSKSVIVQMQTVMNHLEELTQSSSPIIFPLGLSVNGDYPLGNFSNLVHLLVAGYTGSGKSVFLQSIIITLLLRTNPSDLKLVLIDPKQVEFSKYDRIPHLLMPIITNTNTALLSLEKMINKMEQRYTYFTNNKVKDISSYNKKVAKKDRMPYIIIIIDELADLIMAAQDNRLENVIVRLAQKARAAGIHLVVSTQRPSAEVVTGLIKSNLPTRIAFSLASWGDSKIILDESGAELLLGRGDMLFKASGVQQVERIQGVFTSEGEIDRVVDWVVNQGEPEFDEEFLNLQSNSTSFDNEMFEVKEKITRDHIVAINIIINQYERKKTISISGLQRTVGIGHSKAARIVDSLTMKGILSEDTGNNKPRDIIGSIEDLQKVKAEWQSKL